MTYVGRFAPSPTGPLHLGSLATAVASFLDARRAGGEWLVRIEDIDPPREPAGAAERILVDLAALGLDWDRTVVYQSARFERYLAVAEDLLARGLAFRCSCSRRQIAAAAGTTGAAGVSGRRGPYPGTCRTRRAHHGPTSVRARVEPGVDIFDDGLQGTVGCDLAATEGDYVIFRRDGLPAYHLAAVLDDAEAGVTHVVRGVDLLDCTPVHRHLQRVLGLPSPAYFHLPVLTHPDGAKLSKQTGAPPIDTSNAPALAARVLSLLGLDVPDDLAGAGPAVLWRWAAERWDIRRLRGRRAIVADGASA